MLKKLYNAVKTYVNRIINSELFPILLGLILFVKVALFYKLTIYQADSYNISILSKTFIYSMFIVTFLYAFKNRMRFTLGTILNLLVSILLFADNLYYNYSTSLISVSQISNLQYSEQISTALKDLFKYIHLLYFVDLFVLVIMLITRFLKIQKIKDRAWKPAIVYVVMMTIVYGSTIPGYVQAAEEYRYNKKMQLEYGTIYTFHFLDLKTNINLKKTAKYSNKEDLMVAYDELKELYSENYQDDLYNLKGYAQGMNVIVLQLESFQEFLLYKEINGKEITPNLNKFVSENVQFKNMMIQSYSTTADSEHSTYSSLYPLENGMAFAQYSSNEYDDFFKEYHDAGYYTMYMHGNEGSFWNRNNVYGHLDIDELDFIEAFDAEDTYYINEWVSDESLYIQAVEKFKNAAEKTGKPFFANVVAASSHNAFDLPGLDNKYDYVDIDVGEYKGMFFGDYLEAVNYADKQFGLFIDKLKEAGLYDNTIIAVFGDHYGMQMYNYEMLDFIEEKDHRYNTVETEINYINVPMVYRIPGIEHMVIDKTVSKLDIKPTLCYLTGSKDGFSLGTNMFGSKDFACLNNGVIVTDDYYYNGYWYYRSNGEQIDLDNIDEELKNKLNYYIECMEKELSISNSVVLNNLLK
ncbi:MAG: sulfatase-like hydrolase/transferase [Clostridia bacterium]|nr:sulfatase-like hydrolase/transferase [Clostridia bacterium]